MEVIMPISDRVVVFDYGIKIAEDVPEKIAHNVDVIKAYLGDKYNAVRS
jgi:branched-chain amino acid transport system ATP-binding protein